MCRNFTKREAPTGFPGYSTPSQGLETNKYNSATVVSGVEAEG